MKICKCKIYCKFERDDGFNMISVVMNVFLFENEHATITTFLANFKS